MWQRIKDFYKPSNSNYHWVNKRTRQNRIKWTVVVSITAIGIIFWVSGYGHTVGTLNQCDTSISRYVTAEYSETSFYTDANGNIQSETEYWSEPASDKHTTNMVNGKLTSRNSDIEVINDIAYPVMPLHDKTMSRNINFDSFKFHTNANVRAYYTGKNGIRKNFEEPISAHEKCLDRLDRVIIIYTWYRIPYSSDFN